MSLTLYYHPLASFCWKPLIALYENATPFKAHVVNLMDPEERQAFLALSPQGKMPVLHDEALGHLVLESTIVVEYLERHHPGPVDLIPTQGEDSWKVRLLDRFYDFYVHDPMQRVVFNRLRPADVKDRWGADKARADLASAYDQIEREMEGRTWAAGERFTLADCSAAPALHYAERIVPFGGRPLLTAYLARLKARPSFARVLAEALPFDGNFPSED